MLIASVQGNRVDAPAPDVFENTAQHSRERKRERERERFI